jgi:hypothetical protein
MTPRGISIYKKLLIWCKFQRKVPPPPPRHIRCKLLRSVKNAPPSLFHANNSNAKQKENQYTQKCRILNVIIAENIGPPSLIENSFILNIWKKSRDIDRFLIILRKH